MFKNQVGWELHKGPPGKNVAEYRRAARELRAGNVRNFAKSVLNYFAAFTETRFRFSRKLPYEWSDDSFTLDLSVFPNFQRELLAAVAGGSPFCLGVAKGQYAVALDPVTVTAELAGVIQASLHNGFLESQIVKSKAKLQEAVPDLVGAT